MFGKCLFFASALLAGTTLGAMAGTVTAVTNTPLDGAVYGFLLTDGSLFFQGGDLQDFYRFKPDNKGSYVNGTLYPAAALPPNYIPYATSGGVLPDGRVLLIGGEYTLVSNNTLTFDLTNKMAIYNPKADTWTMVAPPFGPNWDFIGDSPWTLLSNGHVLLGSKLSTALVELDPTTLKWTHVSSFGKIDRNAEEGWTLLPDGSVLTVNVSEPNASPNAQRFIPNTDPTKSLWVDAGTTPVKLPATDINAVENSVYDNGMRVYHPPGEIGTAILRPDGTVFVTGANCNVPGPRTQPSACRIYQPHAYTAIYDWKTNTWTKGPDLPDQEGAGDTFASLLPSGNVFFQISTVPGLTADPLARANARYASIRGGAMHPLAAEAQAPTAAPQQACPPNLPPYHFYEFDGTKIIHEPAADFCGQPSTLLLPTGQVMLNLQVVYTPSGKPLPTWAPKIKSFASSNNVNPGGTYRISGTQFNGLSQANAFNDEFQVATNFPLVRITNDATGDVSYARTYNFSTMGVATGDAIVSTAFDVPTDIETGASHLAVVANGIPSAPIPITVKPGALAASAN
jgi:hypothetical protein